MDVDVLTPEGTSAGSVELPAEYFDVQVNVPLIHQVVVAQLAAARQGTHDTKNRGEVRGGGRKPYKQKGTGRARQGSVRAPQFTGGGVVHGPTPRDYAQRTPKKMKAAALLGALSDRARNNRVHVVSEIVVGELPSAKSAAATLAAVSERANVLAVVTREDVIGWKSLRNLAGVHLLVVDQLNTYDVLCSDDVVFTSAALQEFLDTRPAGKPVATAAPAVEVAKPPKPAAKRAEPAVQATKAAEPETVKAKAEPKKTEPAEPKPASKAVAAEAVAEVAPAESEPASGATAARKSAAKVADEAVAVEVEKPAKAEQSVAEEAAPAKPKRAAKAAAAADVAVDEAATEDEEGAK